MFKKWICLSLMLLVTLSLVGCERDEVRVVCDCDCCECGRGQEEEERYDAVAEYEGWRD